jgi:hypothetical protein
MTDMLLVAASDGSGAAGGLLALWLGMVAGSIWGVVRLFRGGNTGVGIAALLVPFVFIAGFLMAPRPGTGLYLAQDAVKRARADQRYPVEAEHFHRMSQGAHVLSQS